MTDGRHRFRDCPDAETLAAFMDDRLAPRDRAGVEPHLAECEECYEVWMEGIRTANDAQQQTTTRGPKVGRWVLAATAAASLAALLWGPSLLFPTDHVKEATDRLVSSVGAARFTEARLTPAFAWGAIPSATRGGSMQQTVATRRAALALLALPSDVPPGRSLHAAGIGQLALGALDDSVIALERAAELDPASADVRSDLAAALLERWRRDQVASDAQRALDEARAASRLAPDLLAARFNVAKAADAMGAKQAALGAWRAYLALDADSLWADEARQEAARLEREVAESGKSEMTWLAEEVIDPWAVAQSTGQPFDVSVGRSVARQLRTSGRAAYLVDLFEAVDNAQAMPLAARACLSDAINSMRLSRSAFDASSYRSAHQLAERAAGAFRCAGTSRVDALVQSAWSLAFNDERDEALQLLGTIAPEARRRDYLWQLARTHYIEGISAVGRGHLAGGLQEFDSAAVLFARVGDRSQLAATHVQRADTLMSSGNPDAAWAELRSALSELHAIQRPRLQYLVLSVASLFSVTGGQTDAATVYMELLERVVAAWNVPFVSVDAAARRATLYAGLGRSDDARSAIAQGRSALSAIDDDVLRAQYEAAFGWTETRLALTSSSEIPEEVMAAAMTRIEKANMTYALAEAFYYRGRMHESRGDTDAALSDWHRSADALEAHSQRVGNHDLSVSRTNALWDVYGKLILAARDDPEKSLLVSERSRARDLLVALGASIDPTGNGPDATLLPVDVVGLAYITLPESLIVWHVADGRAQVTVLPVPQRLLKHTIDNWRAGSAEAREVVSRWLLPNDLGSNPSATLVVVPDGPLHGLSFAALHHPTTGRHLVEEYVPVVVPSLAVFRHLAGYPARAHGRALVTGSGEAQPDLGLAALPQVLPEVRRIAEIHGTEALVGRDAARRELLRHLPTASVFHFAGHAIADPRRPSNSRLFVVGDASGDTLSPVDIAAAHLPRGALVVLSACEGALGKTYRGEGAMHLARPFLAAGAGAVLASSEPVSDREAGEFVIAVHEHLARGESLEYGVAQVQRDAIRRHRPASLWTPWMVIGTTGRTGKQ